MARFLCNYLERGSMTRTNPTGIAHCQQRKNAEPAAYAKDSPKTSMKGFSSYTLAAVLRDIPKGLHHSAQRCRDEGTATLGDELKIEINSEGVESNRGDG
jgi:hypothetical protein